MPCLLRCAHCSFAATLALLDELDREVDRELASEDVACMSPAPPSDAYDSSETFDPGTGSSETSLVADCSELFLVTCNFRSLNTEELSVRKGDIVEIKSRRVAADDGWWTAWKCHQMVCGEMGCALGAFGGADGGRTPLAGPGSSRNLASVASGA